VIQHTPSVEKTAHALYALTAPGGEFVFNCYGLDDEIRELVNTLQPDITKILNMDKYFLRPAPIGCALRIFR